MVEIMEKQDKKGWPSDSKMVEYFRNVPPKEKHEIYQELNRTTYTEKLKLWLQRFGCITETHTFSYRKKSYIFSILPEASNTQEQIDFNKWYFENFINEKHLQDWIKNELEKTDINQNSYFRYVYIDKCKNNFGERYKRALDKKNCIESEREKIREWRKIEPIREFWDIYKTGSEPDFRNKYFTTQFILQKKIGQTLAFYERYLNALNRPVPDYRQGTSIGNSIERSKDKMLIEKIANEVTDKTKKPTKEIKTPKLHELNRPVLNEQQIAILFYVFKDKKTFINRDIEKTDLAKILSQLSGYAPEPFRQKLSEHTVAEIATNKKQFDQIIHELKEVIKELEKQKNAVS